MTIQFLKFWWRRRPDPSGQMGRQMLFDYSRFLKKYKATVERHLFLPVFFSGFHRANISGFGVDNSSIVLRIQCKRLEVYCFHILRDADGKRLRRFPNIAYLLFIWIINKSIVPVGSSATKSTNPYFSFGSGSSQTICKQFERLANMQ